MTGCKRGFGINCCYENMGLSVLLELTAKIADIFEKEMEKIIKQTSC